MTSQQQPEALPALFAIVQLFGHQRIAGRISEQTFGGQTFVRIDVPEIDLGDGRTMQAHTRSFGQGAIYGIDWCDETAMVVAARQIQHAPIASYSVVAALRSLPQAEKVRLLGSGGDLLDDDGSDDGPF